MSMHGYIRVYDPKVMRDLCAPTPTFSESSERSGPRTRSEQSSRQKVQLTKQDMKQKRHQQFLHEQDVIRANGQRIIKENRQEKARRDQEKFNRNYKNLTAGHQQMKDIGEMLEMQEETNRRKLRTEHGEWHQKVFEPIAAEVSRNVNALNYKKINKRKNEEYQQFLDTINRKGAIFRDIIIESEYDPLESNRKDIKVKMDKLNDPINRCLDKAVTEERLAQSGTTKPSVGPAISTRGTLDVLQWGTGKIEATPHGYFSKMIAEPGAQSKPDSDRITRSKVFMDHYQMPGKAALDAEFPKGKKVDIAKAEDW